MNAKCKQCGKEIIQKNKHYKKKFCNNSCSTTYRNLNNRVYKKGKNNPLYGTKLPLQQRKKISKTISDLWKDENSKYRTDEFIYKLTHRRHTEERKRKSSKRMTGKGNPMYGKTHTPEAKKKIRSVDKSYTKTKEFRLKISNGVKNSDLYKNAVQKPSYRENLSKALKGRIISEEWKENMRLATIQRIKNQNSEGLFIPNIGKNETNLLNNIEKEKGIKLVRQFPVIGYFVDGYDKENNVVYEVDEKYHKRIKQQNKDIIRQQNIINAINCKFIRIEDY